MSSNLTVCAIGDTHGHLQLALCMAARWQRELNKRFDAVLLCGDVGTFTDETQLDSATRRPTRSNPCELEFMHQWSVTPQPPWLDVIFEPVDGGGLGLTCPVIMVHGNHEGFPHLATLRGEWMRRQHHEEIPTRPVDVDTLPVVDSGGHIRYLPSGCRCALPCGITIGGLGGIEPGHRHAKYHEMAYLDDTALLSMLHGDPCDVLITHQGPARVQGPAGSKRLDEQNRSGIHRPMM
ncbi:MAG: metallophosphoesterase [Planctomycetota bacterium]